MRTALIAVLIAIGMTVTVTACTTVAPPPLAATGTASPAGFATLALWGEWESDLAPAYTRLAVLRHRAARMLDARRIDVAVAIAVQAEADRARNLLDDSRRGNSKTPSPRQRQQLADAIAAIAAAETRLEQ